MCKVWESACVHVCLFVHACVGAGLRVCLTCVRTCHRLPLALHGADFCFLRDSDFRTRGSKPAAAGLVCTSARPPGWNGVECSGGVGRGGAGDARTCEEMLGAVLLVGV